ncbi:MAG: DHH family phosphoesterase [Oscillospiraceae bacterium]|jgi:c-di-AMP phosphodiesterase-like protein|nr:DHH family phosphoesterase [Oscillospiraceae bacterium]
MKIFLSPQLLAVILIVVLTLALAVVLLAGALVRWQRRQREREQQALDWDTNDPETLHTEIERLRPCALQIELDGVDELRRGFRESVLAELRASIEALLEDWADVHEGLFLKAEDDRYLLLVQRPMLRRMIENKFAILDKVRGYQFRGERAGVTISIGVGQGDTFAECGANSRQALELALGRGGDQAAVKHPDLSYQFFGGVSKRVEKSEKVKVRMTAAALAEIMQGCEQVLAVGHKRADFDSLGAAAGVCAIAKAQDKPAFIVLEEETCMARPLLAQWKDADGAPAVITPRKALNDLSAKTLVVLVDAHAAAMAESPQLLVQAKLVVVIDHHRQSVEHIRDALMFHLDPGASSACEMVTELLQYTIPAPKIAPCQTNALLAGIQLDTRNFVLRTGTATFEAAAWLRGKGADPVQVRRLFAEGPAEARRKAEIVNRAKVIDRCAVSIALPAAAEDMRLICAQAADELLNLEEVDASFVLFAQSGTVFISARSLGARNVQLVMEQLGGGGHQTMAAAQLENVTTEEAVRRLAQAIKDTTYSS